MKAYSYIKSIFCCVVLVCFTNGCVNDLDTLPLDPETSTPNNLFKDPSSYKAVLAKLYAGLAVTGQQGPAGNADIEGIDEGSAGTCGVDHLTCLQDASDSIAPTATAWRYFEAHAASLDRCPDQAADVAYKLYTDQFLEDLIACFDEPTCDAVESCRNVVWAPLD